MEFILRKVLERRLKETGMTAAQLARRTGVAKQVLSDWLAGAAPRNLTQLKAVAVELRVSVDELCFGPSATPSRSDELHVTPFFAQEGHYEVSIRRVVRNDE